MATVLLVEDDEIVQHVHKLMLNKLGYKVYIADNAQNTLSLISERSFDLIFVDIGLPDISGIELIKYIKTISQIPIVALTGYTSQVDHIACISAGASEVLHKPITSEKLKQLLNQYLLKRNEET